MPRVVSGGFRLSSTRCQTDLRNNISDDNCEDSIGTPLGIRLSRGRRESERERERDPREYSIFSNITNSLMYASTHFTQSAQSVPTLADNLNTRHVRSSHWLSLALIGSLTYDLTQPSANRMRDRYSLYKKCCSLSFY